MKEHHISGLQATSSGLVCVIFTVGADRKRQKVGGLMLDTISTLPAEVQAKLEIAMGDICTILDGLPDGGTDEGC